MGKTEKTTSDISIIGAADGPTSFFITGKGKKTIRQKVQAVIFKIRKLWIEKHIKANPHSMSEVINYIKDKYGFMELDSSSDEYQNEYKQMRTSFIIQYAPELLGEYKNYPKLESKDEEKIQNFMEELLLRQKIAESISKELFDIEFYIFEKKQADVQMNFLIESKYGYIGGGFSGSGKAGKREYEKMFRDIYRYYGVSKNDIKHKTKRYERVIRALTVR